MIHRISQSNHTVWAISAQHVWRPGSFASEKAARMGQRLDDEDLLSLQYEANRAAGGAGGIITCEMIREYRARARTQP